MHGKYKRKKQAQQTQPRPDRATVSPGVNQEPTAKKEGTNERDSKKEPSMNAFVNHLRSPRFVLELVAVVVGLGVLGVYFCQLRVMQQQVNLAERGWIGFVQPPTFPLDGATTPATIQVTNFGKTPARQVEGDMVAAVLMKGEEPTFDYSLGHPHNRFYAGVVFPNSPFPVTIDVVRYINKTPTAVSSADLRKELESGQSYVVFYGQIAYKDIFGIEHWTHFCTGSGKAMQELDTLKKCIRYNDVDHDQ